MNQAFTNNSMQVENTIILDNIRVLCHKGRLANALEAMELVDQHGKHIPVRAFYHLLQASIMKKDLTSGRKVYNLIIKHGFSSNSFLGAHLIRMFALHGSLLEADQVFVNLSKKQSIFTWHAIISAHTMLGEGEKALNLYCQMQNSGIDPGEHVFVAVLKACCSISSLDCGMLIHGVIIENTFESYAYLGSSLIDMYSKCESLVNARRVFDQLCHLDLVTWSAMISGYAQQERGYEALCLLEQMRKNGMNPDGVTLVSCLKACSDTRNLESGKVIHGDIVRNFSEVLDVYVGSSLIDMYNACGQVGDARNVFETLPVHNVVTWSAMFAGYALHGPGEEALRLFLQMLQNAIEPNNVTCVSLLKACCNIAALEQGRLIHSLVFENSFESHVHIKSTIIDMYAKCGSLDDAKSMFENVFEHNKVTWNALIAGYAQWGDYASTIDHFRCMQKQGIKPNDVTFVSLLSSCSQFGFLKEACHAFQSLGEDLISLDHYNCMIDLLGRLGRTTEAEDLLRMSPFQSNCVGWSSLLGHCKRHGDVRKARICFHHLVEIDDQYSSGYAVMNNVYIDAGMWIDANKVRDLQGGAYAWKKPGKAFIEVQNRVHDFIVGDKTHPECDEISVKLRRLHIQLKQVGYTPEICLQN